MAQVDSDARPGGGPASHGVDQDIVDRQKAGNLRMFRLPPFETRERGALVWRIGYNDERHFDARLLRG